MVRLHDPLQRLLDLWRRRTRGLAKYLFQYPTAADIEHIPSIILPVYFTSQYFVWDLNRRPSTQQVTTPGGVTYAMGHVR